MKAEGTRKVEMRRAGVLGPASNCLLNLFSAYNSWGDDE